MSYKNNKATITCFYKALKRNNSKRNNNNNNNNSKNNNINNNQNYGDENYIYLFKDIIYFRVSNYAFVGVRARQRMKLNE